MKNGGSHYTDLGIQPIEVTRAWLTEEEYAGYLRGNIIKYIGRYKGKGGRRDLEKAKDYLEELIDVTA